MKLRYIERYKAIALLAVSGVFLTTSCAKFEEINTNQLLPTDKHKQLDGLASGGLFPGLMQKVIPTGNGGTDFPNTYQNVINMTGDNWIGYFSPGAYPWDGGSSFPNYYATDGRLDGVFASMSDIMNSYLQVKVATHNLEITPDKKYVFHKKDLKEQAIYSVAQIVKIMGFHRATDMFGPMPYSKVEPGVTYAPYDSQEAIYQSFYEELKEAVTTLNNYKASSAKIIQDYDPVYQGNVENWVKLGNSLMLRLGLRVRFADKTLATNFITTALDPNNGGVITEVKDAAKLVSNGKYRFFHSLYTLSVTYNEVKMGATIHSFLKGYNDARIEKYFHKGKDDLKEDYHSVRLGVRNGDYKGFSAPIVEENSATYWMRPSEVQFLLAEARLAGIITEGTVQGYYENGVALSFQEAGASLGDYLRVSATPASYTDPKNAQNNLSNVSTVDRKWDEGDIDEVKLEKIITQKYLAIFPDGLEAWSEWRRTGYPRIFKEVQNLSNIGAVGVSASGKNGGMRRFPFPLKEHRLNKDNVAAAKGMLGGVDKASTNVWWDKKSK
ncbi:SusD/RagB family nutrient-binding outer membrane lipoprotein [Capnocytophaga sp.]|uniref:SusD/RagB family nutrient-binding outer membrane lipoprotein n=1 Tax=Capnocytophaga sp. TaxID=44737 RepID=UPI0026DA9B46|nr:SusD/RagB family nutrient-binding outer membrane lipoprotein [Capnocytophaga sp.]MDO5105432.1 SusD/RagB family nutrient-binding outer membrane lipoprotein [Capnocytophaga sp.]